VRPACLPAVEHGGGGGWVKKKKNLTLAAEDLRSKRKKD